MFLANGQYINNLSFELYHILILFVYTFMNQPNYIIYLSIYHFKEG